MKKSFDSFGRELHRSYAMTDQQKPPTSENLRSSSCNSKFNPESNSTNNNFSGHKVRYPNSPDAANPDPEILKEQRRYAIKRFSRWNSHAWGAAIFAGLSFYALGWFVKGSNPLPSYKRDSNDAARHDGDGDNAK